VRVRDETKRRAILSGALGLVEQYGLAGLSIDAVAKAAGVGTGTVYVYFANKEALLNALYVEAKCELSREIFEGTGPGVAVKPAFERMCVAYLRYVATHRADVVFIHQFCNSPYVFEPSKEMAGRALAPLVELLERAKAEGLLKGLPVPLMITFLQGTLTEMAAYVASEPKKQQEQRHLEVARLCWDALKE
jgi:AcrR family transcriptional regulator